MGGRTGILVIAVLGLIGVTIGVMGRDSGSDRPAPATEATVATTLAGLPDGTTVGIAASTIPGTFPDGLDLQAVASVDEVVDADFAHLIIGIGAPDDVQAWAEDNGTAIATGPDDLTLYDLTGGDASSTTLDSPETTAGSTSTSTPPSTSDPVGPSPTSPEVTTPAPTTTTTVEATTSTTDVPTTTTTIAPTTTTTSPPPPPPEPPPRPAPTPAPPSTGGPSATTIEVEPGDSFWTIAAAEVETRLGHPPTDAEITGYWAELVQANTGELVEPGNPDLILPGQVLVLPPG